MSAAPLPIRDQNNEKPPFLTILGVPVHSLTMGEVLSYVEQFMAEPRLHQIATVNPEFIMAAQEDPIFLKVLNEADICLADGVGLLLAGRWLGKSLPERVAGSDFVYHLSQLAAENGWRLFLLGAAAGVAEEAAVVFQNNYPGLIITGTYAGSPDPSENQSIVQRINDSAADILYVAYGAPKQDKWIAHNRHALRTVRIAVGIGGSLDFVAGRATRAPRWLQNAGLEWLHRLYKEPWRWRRMMALPQFAIKVMRQGRQDR